MSSSDGSLGSTGSFSLSATPYTWILTPLVVFLSIGILATLIQFQRRRRLRKLGLQRPWPRRDLEANRPGTGRQRSSRNGRWAWTTRTDEGLDEFGEAPPAYEPKAKPGQTLAREGSFEMHHVEYTATGAIPPPPPIGGIGADRGSLPPDYGTATGSTSSSRAPVVTSPPPAAMRN
ncbi:hypothetical protein EsH8_V_000425 [Colletotrichum jinshuiense]